MRNGNIVILTGAGISAESGLQTFRAADGLWEGHKVEDVATPQAFERDPALVHAFYDARRERAAAVEPNAAHRALAELEGAWSGELLTATGLALPIAPVKGQMLLLSAPTVLAMGVVAP